MSGYNYDEQIEEIMNNFDFHKVRTVMRVMGWTWHEDEHPPSIGRLRETALKLLTKLKDKDSIINSTGGFEAIKFEEELHLYFCVEEYSGG